jgi:hypothetical protein
MMEARVRVPPPSIPKIIFILLSCLAGTCGAANRSLFARLVAKALANIASTSLSHRGEGEFM